MTKPKEPEAPAKPEPIRRRVNILVTGVAPDDLDVSRWMGALSRLPFLSGIRLEVSEEKEVRGLQMRQFKISMKLEPEADVRGWEGLQDLRTPPDPIERGALEGAKIMTVAPEKPAEPAPAPDAAPALVNENPEADQNPVDPGAAQTAAGSDPSKEEVKP